MVPCCRFGPTATAIVAAVALLLTGGAPAALAQMGGEMGMHGGGMPQQLYPTLMGAPPADPTAREAALREAHRRMTSGLPLLSSGLDEASRALQTGDPQAMREAADRLAEGLNLYRSGLSTHLALGAGQTPAQAALGWYRGQLGLPVATAAPTAAHDGGALWGLSWYHLTTMAFLVAFLIGTTLIQFTRMRRVSGLVQRLATASPVAQPAAAVAAAGSPSLPPVASPPPEIGTLPTPGPPAVSAAAVDTRLAAPAACTCPSPGEAIAAAKQPWSGMLRVAAIFPETSNVKTFRLVDPGGAKIPFVFMPGQFLTLSAEIDGERMRRSYTIASSPTQQGYVEITVKREEQGHISRYLHDRVPVGVLLEAAAPSGVFTFTGAEGDSIVLIAGGVGITPMMSIIRYLTDCSYPGDIFLVYGARAPADFIFREELEYLQKRHSSLHVAATMSRAEGSAWIGATGPVTKELIARAVPRIAQRRVHLCGPPPMMEAVKTALSELGVPKDQVKTEAFGPARGVAPGPRAPLATVAPSSPPVARAAPAAVPRIATADVRFTRSGKAGALAPDQTVLEAAEALGVGIDYSCRVGICGTCRVRLLKGEVTMEVEEGLPPEEKARGIILACQAKSVGSLEIEA